MGTETSPPGVTFLDHTADVGLDVRAPTEEVLFQRAARGMLRLLQEPDQNAAEAEGERRRVALTADDRPALLRAWLRELLWWHEVEGMAFHDARFSTLEARHLEAQVSVVPADATPIREIKGVTLHGLRAEDEGGEWRARVIFDV